MATSTGVTLYETWHKHSVFKRFIIHLLGVPLGILIVFLGFFQMSKTLVVIGAVMTFGMMNITNTNNFVSISFCAKWIKTNQINYTKYFEQLNKCNNVEYISTAAAYLHEHPKWKMPLISFVIGLFFGIVTGLLIGFIFCDMMDYYLKDGPTSAAINNTFHDAQVIVKIIFSFVSLCLSFLNQIPFDKKKILAWRQEIMQNKKEM